MGSMKLKLRNTNCYTLNKDKNVHRFAIILRWELLERKAWPKIMTKICENKKK